MRAQDGHRPLDQFCTVSTGMRLCYRTYGPDYAEPLLLIAGLALHLTSWSPRFIEGLVQRGYHVITFDNRDVGRSSRHASTPPGVWRQLTRRIAPEAYDLSDMARDAVGLLDHLQIEQAHLVGMSMGGMIAQTMAATHANRAHSLTSIFSTTGARRVGQPAASTMWLLSRSPARTRDEAAEGYLQMMRHIGSQGFDRDEEALRAYAEEAWDRGNGATAREGVARQIGAIIKSGDRTSALKEIRIPTLVVHGDRDRIVHPSGGHATAQAIPGARHITIHGMGHQISEGVVPYLVDLIDGHAQRSPQPEMATPMQPDQRRSA